MVDGPPAVVAVLEALAEVVLPVGIVAPFHGGCNDDESVNSQPDLSVDVAEVCDLPQQHSDAPTR